MNWISVEEALPEKDNCYVLVACDSGLVEKSFYCTNKDFLRSQGQSYSRKQQGKLSGYFAISHTGGYKITHWMELPEAPV